MTGFLISIALGFQPATGQFIEDYQTNIIALGTSTWSGNYYVGNTNFADALLLEDNGVLSTTKGYSFVGYTGGTSNNSVFITGTGSVWSTAGAYIGYSGAGNSLTISNGGHAVSTPVYNNFVGYNTSSSNNSVLITGPGSVWSNIALYAGNLGASNNLTVSNGGKLIVTRILFLGYLNQSNGLVVSDGGQAIDMEAYIGANTSGSCNRALITGAGSLWSNSELEVGFAGAQNSLVISNAGLVIDTVAHVGSNSNSLNTAQVADDAVWQNTSLTVGNQGSSNSLVVAGGSVYATTLVVGAASATCDNILELDSGSVIVTNATGTGVLEIRTGELIVNGGTLMADTLVITNPCASFIHTGGSVIVSNLVLDPNTFRIVSVAQQTNDMLVTWMMAPGATNTLQATAGDGTGGYSTNGYSDSFIVTNNTTVGTVTNYLDLGAATNTPARYYRARLNL